MHNDFSARPGAAVVVGATGGIGAAIARMLRDRGSAVALTYRVNAAAADALVAEGAARAWQLALTDADACVQWVRLSRGPPAQFRGQLEQDAVGFFNLVSPALPYLRQTSGSLVAVTTA